MSDDQESRSPLAHNSLSRLQVSHPPLILPPMLEEVPLPSFPGAASPPDFQDYSSYTSLLDIYQSEYSDELPSEIMNHFRTSSPRPAYQDTIQETSQETISCDYELFLSPCNPHLPSFTIEELSKMSELSRGRSPSPSPPSSPSPQSPPSGRVPYPSFRPDYSELETEVTPLVSRPRHYVPSSTIRPPAWREEERRVLEITTYKPRITLSQETTTSSSNTEERIRERLREILIKLREKKMKEQLEETEQQNIPNLNKFNQRRKNGQRLYPNNPINPHLPVTSSPPLNTTHRHNDNSPEDFFTVKNRNLGGSSDVLLPSNLLFFLLFMSQHVLGF